MNMEERCKRYEAALAEIAHGWMGPINYDNLYHITSGYVKLASKALAYEQMLDDGWLDVNVDFPPEKTLVKVKCAIGERHLAFWVREGNHRKWYDWQMDSIQMMVEEPEFWKPTISFDV